MNYIGSIMPEEATELVNYFDQTYISGFNKIINISRSGNKPHSEIYHEIYVECA